MMNSVFAIKNIAARACLTGFLAIILSISGCAMVANPDPRDPWEAYNRPMTQFNEKLDAVLLKPAATAYQAVTPAFVRTGLSNFFRNLGEPWTALNAALQFKGVDAVETITRFGINTFMGLGGLLEVASEFGIDRHYADFGQTLGQWGVPTGPYLVLPFFGPATLRDATAFSIESAADPINQQTNLQLKDTLNILRALELRANALRAGNVLEEAALDQYTFLRDIFLQRRDNFVYDGKELKPGPEPVEK
jgi:phospholipid-binding lipoprotein MlaA